MTTLCGTTETEIEPLRGLVKAGKLFAVQDWLLAGKPVVRVGSKRWAALEIAADMGFQSTGPQPGQTTEHEAEPPGAQPTED